MVNYCGIEMKNPVIAASATPTIGPRNLRLLSKIGAGAAVTKSIVFPKTPEEGEEPKKWGINPRPRFMLLNAGLEYDPGITERGGYFTLFRWGELYPTPDEYAEGIRELKKEIDMPIIASICGAPQAYDQWKQLAEIVQDAGADAIELNMHCLPTAKYNQTDPEIVRAVKSVTKIPVIAKLMAAWEIPEEIGPKVVEAGADAITAIGTFGHQVLEVDAEKEELFFQPALGGMGGTWFRPVGLAWIARLARVVDVPLSGVTGIASWQDAVKYILLGATTIQICGALYAKGYGLINEVDKGIKGFMERHGYESIEDFRGKLLNDLRPSTDLPYNPPVKAEVESDTCTGCEACVDTCFYSAITMQDEKAVVDQDACDGCGTCTWMCPVDAPKMVEVG